MDPTFAAALDWPSTALTGLMSRLDLAALGIAYLVFLANTLAAALCFVLARACLVVSPNPAARDYGLYVSVMLVALLTIMVIENQLRPIGSPVLLPYAALPHLAALLMIHMAIYCRQEPWLIALGAASVAGALPVVAALGILTHSLRPPHWIALALAAGLLVFLWLKSVTTKRSFVKAQSIYIGTKELRRLTIKLQTPWLGLPQWVALGAASVALATLNEILRGSALTQVPAVKIALEATALLAITAFVSSVPATTYWLARKTWMPELTRLVWLVWLVVGFAFTYRNVLTSMLPA
jgi:hypothetical protein